MITGFFLSIFYAFALFFVNLLPTIAYPTAIASSIVLVVGYMNAANFIFPVSTLITVLGLAFSYHGAILLWRLMHLIGGYIRGR